MPISGIPQRTLSAAQVLAAITSDSIKFKGADIDAPITGIVLPPSTIRFYSEQIDCFITGAAVTRPLSSIAVPNFTGMPTIKHAKAGLAFVGYNQFASKLNKFDGTQYIQVDTGSAGWINALLIDNAQFGVSEEGLSYAELMGHYDIKDKVAFGQTTDFQWLDSMVDASSLYLHPICILEIIL